MNKDEIISRLNDINAGLVTEIDQLKQDREEVRRLCDEAVFSLDRVIRRLEKERDEARTAGQHFAEGAMGENWALWEGAVKDYPWLKEEPGSTF